MFDLPIPQTTEEPKLETHDIKIGHSRRHRIQVLDEGRKRKLTRRNIDYLFWATAAIGAAFGYGLFYFGITEALPILLISCMVLLYLR